MGLWGFVCFGLGLNGLGNIKLLLGIKCCCLLLFFDLFLIFNCFFKLFIFWFNDDEVDIFYYMILNLCYWKVCFGSYYKVGFIKLLVYSYIVYFIMLDV